MAPLSGSQQAEGCTPCPTLGCAGGGWLEVGGYQAADTMHQEGTALLLQRLLRMCILCTNWATEGNGP